MKFRQLTTDGDFSMGKGLNNFTTGFEAFILDLLTRLKEWKNDCFFNLPAGIDRLNRLEVNQKTNLENDIKNIILNTNGAISLTSFQTSLIDREFICNFEVSSIYSKSYRDTLNLQF